MTRTVRIILHRNSACSSVAKGIYNSAGKAAVFYDDDGTGLMQNFRRQTTEPDLEVVEPIAFHRKCTHDLKPIFALIADDDVDATFVARRQGGCYSKSSMWLSPAPVDSPRQISN